MEEKKLLTVVEFAEEMRISLSTAYALIKEGKIKVLRLGDRYFIPAWVMDEMLKGACVKGGERC